jgi:4-hydroxyproline epimerase
MRFPTGPVTLQVIDSHTGGEPTRTLIAGGPDLGAGSLAERRRRMNDEVDWIRTTLINEPRGSDVFVGAILCKPLDPSCDAGVIFFNNTGYLNMCGHGMIGFVVTLAHLGTLQPGVHRIETPVGVVTATLQSPNRVSFENVPSYRYRTSVALDLGEFGVITGDIAWGGNWFFLAEVEGVTPGAIPQLTTLCQSIREELECRGITGKDGQVIDHIEVFGQPSGSGPIRNFVLCPGFAYDRSPCGTGTSAKVACLAADGKLAPGAIWRQESIIGSVFEATYRHAEGADPEIDGPVVVPTVTGSAYVNAEINVIVNPADPFAFGIGANLSDMPERGKGSMHG